MTSLLANYRNQLLLLLLFGLISPIKAQLDYTFYYVDTLSMHQSAILPHIYFRKYRKDITAESKEDVTYLVNMLREYPQMQIRLVCDGQMRRWELRQRRLNRKRLRELVRFLREDYGVDKKRLIVVSDDGWNHRSAKAPEPHNLEFRRIRCEAVFPYRFPSLSLPSPSLSEALPQP